MKVAHTTKSIGIIEWGNGYAVTTTVSETWDDGQQATHSTRSCTIPPEETPRLVREIFSILEKTSSTQAYLDILEEVHDECCARLDALSDQEDDQPSPAN